MSATPSLNIFTQIARRHFGVSTLETRKSDSLDFYNVSVWEIESALKAAFDAGRDASRSKATRRSRGRRQR